MATWPLAADRWHTHSARTKEIKLKPVKVANMSWSSYEILTKGWEKETKKESVADSELQLSSLICFFSDCLQTIITFNSSILLHKIWSKGSNYLEFVGVVFQLLIINFFKTKLLGPVPGSPVFLWVMVIFLRRPLTLVTSLPRVNLELFSRRMVPTKDGYGLLPPSW